MSMTGDQHNVTVGFRGDLTGYNRAVQEAGAYMRQFGAEQQQQLELIAQSHERAQERIVAAQDAAQAQITAIQDRLAQQQLATTQASDDKVAEIRSRSAAQQQAIMEQLAQRELAIRESLSTQLQVIDEERDSRVLAARESTSTQLVAIDEQTAARQAEIQQALADRLQVIRDLDVSRQRQQELETEARQSASADSQAAAAAAATDRAAVRQAQAEEQVAARQAAAAQAGQAKVAAAEEQGAAKREADQAATSAQLGSQQEVAATRRVAVEERAQNQIVASQEISDVRQEATAERTAARQTEIQEKAAVQQAAVQRKAIDDATAKNNGLFASLTAGNQSTRELGRGFLYLGGAIDALVADASVQFSKFQKQQTEVAVATGANLKQQHQLYQQALDDSQTSSFSALQVASAQEQLGRAGLGAATILGGALSASLNLAAATSSDTTTAAHGLAVALNIFQISGGNAAVAADALTAAARNVPGGLNGIVTGLQQVGPVAHEMNISLNDTVGVLGLLQQNGQNASQAGSQLRQTLISTTPRSKQAADAMNFLGLSFYDVQGKFVGVANMAGQLHDKLSKLSDQERQNALSTIFQTRSLTGVSILYEQGAEGVQKWINATQDAGLAARLQQQQLDNLQGDWHKLSAALDTALIQGGSKATGTLRGITQEATGLVNTFNNMPSAVQTGISAFATGAGGLLTFAGLLGTLIPRIQSARSALKEFGATYTEVQNAEGATSVERTGGFGDAANTAVGAAGKIAVAVGAAIAIYEAYNIAIDEASKHLYGNTASVEDNEQALLKWDKQLNVSSGTQKELTGALADEYGANFQKINQKVSDSTLSLQTFFKVSKSDPGTIQRLGLLLNPVTAPVGAVLDLAHMRSANSELDKTDKALADLVKQGNQDVAIRLFDNFINGSGLTGTALDHLKSKFNDFRGALVASQNAQDAAAQSNNGFIGGLQGLDALAPAAQRGLQGMGDAAQEYAANQKEATQDEKDFAKAITDFVKPTDIWNQTLSDTRTNLQNQASATEQVTYTTDKYGKSVQHITHGATQDISDMAVNAATSLKQFNDNLEANLFAQAQWQNNLSMIAASGHAALAQNLEAMGKDAAPLVQKVWDSIRSGNSTEADRTDKLFAAQGETSAQDFVTAQEQKLQLLSYVYQTHGKDAATILAQALNDNLVTVQQAAAQYGLTLDGVVTNAQTNITNLKNIIQSPVQMGGAIGGQFGVPGESSGVFAAGGIVEEHTPQIGNGRVTRVWNEPETQGEAYIPLANDWRRPGARAIAAETVDRLGGVAMFAAGGISDAPAPQAGLLDRGRIGTSEYGALGMLGLYAQQNLDAAGVYAANLQQLIAIDQQVAGAEGSGQEYRGDPSKIANDAARYLGIPYLWGGTNPRVGLDCSGLVLNVFRDLGVSMPRVAADQMHVGRPIGSLADAVSGDLVGFGSDFHHIGIYVGNGQMIDAPHTGTNVRYDAVYSGLSGIRRVIEAAQNDVQGSTAGGIRLAVGQAGARVLGQQMATGYGWGSGPEWSALDHLWSFESGWDPNNVNPNGGAYGIPQIYPPAWGHPVALGDARGQIAWGLHYIGSKYRDPIHAWAQEVNSGYKGYASGGFNGVNTYDSGGDLKPGWTLAYNGTGENERIVRYASGGIGAVPSDITRVRAGPGPIATGGKSQGELAAEFAQQQAEAAAKAAAKAANAVEKAAEAQQKNAVRAAKLTGIPPEWATLTPEQVDDLRNYVQTQEQIKKNSFTILFNSKSQADQQTILNYLLSQTTTFSDDWLNIQTQIDKYNTAIQKNSFQILLNTKSFQDQIKTLQYFQSGLVPYTDEWMAIYNQIQDIQKKSDALRKDEKDKVKKYNDDRLKLAQDLGKNLAQAEQQYTDAVKQRTDELASALVPQKWEDPAAAAPVKELLANAHDQLKQMQDYQQGLAQLRTRGVNNDLIKLLGLDNPGAINQVNELLASTPQQLQELMTTLQQTRSAAGTEATADETDVLAQVTKQQQDLRAAYKTDLDNLTTDFNNNLTDAEQKYLLNIQNINRVVDSGGTLTRGVSDVNGADRDVQEFLSRLASAPPPVTSTAPVAPVSLVNNAVIQITHSPEVTVNGTSLTDAQLQAVLNAAFTQSNTNLAQQLKQIVGSR